MIEYSFTKNEIGTLQFNVENKYWQLSEIANIEVEYLEEILMNLKLLLGGEIDSYSFGFEVYRFECSYLLCSVVNLYENDKIELKIKTTEIFKIINDWKNALNKDVVLKKILEKPWDFTLYQKGDQLFLSVLCGGAAMFEVDIELTNPEKDVFFTQGDEYINELVQEIKSNPNNFKERKVDIPL